MAPAIIGSFDWDLAITVGTQVISLAFFSGIGWTSLKNLQRDLSRLEREVVEYRAMREDLAVVKNQLQNIQTCLNSLAHQIEEEREHRNNA